MPVIITAHSTKPGKEDLYEEFMRRRKLWFIRHLPGITHYQVFRTERRFGICGPSGSSGMRYNFVAIIEVDDLAEAVKLSSSDLFQNFVKEYIDLLEDDPALYEAHVVEQTGMESKDDFWRSR